MSDDGDEDEDDEQTESKLNETNSLHPARRIRSFVILAPAAVAWIQGDFLLHFMAVFMGQMRF